jgi:hypothetical protein
MQAPRETLTALFNAEVKRYYQLRPDDLRYLIAITENEKLFVSPAARSKFIQSGYYVLGECPTMFRYELHLREIRHSLSSEKHTASVSHLNRKNVALKIFAISADHFTGSRTVDKIQTLYYVIDHEMGHLLVKEGSITKRNSNLEECAADAFAALLHIQRFGYQAEKFYQFMSKSNLITSFNDPIHYTDAALDAVATIAETDITTIENMSLDKTIETASHIARIHRTGEKELRRMARAYQAVHDYYKKNPDDDIGRITRVIDVMWQHRYDVAIYRPGARHLHRPITQSILKKHMTPLLAAKLALLRRFEQQKGFNLKANTPPKKSLAAANHVR